ncbi:MAG TPA: NAD(P)/FAD-dependent oxidoreductase [Candidatus Acidoferrales bacterium]
MKGRADKIALVGAGLTGPLLAVSLARRGFKVDIYERRPDMRTVQMRAGRSINLAISTRGIHALREAGLWDDLRPIVIPMKGRRMHAVDGKISFQPYGKDENEVINSISRGDLNIALINAAEALGVGFHFEKRCVSVDSAGPALLIRDERSGAETSIDASIVIGTDGSASAIRTEILNSSQPNFSEEFLDYGYKELTISAGADGSHVLDPNALHIWPRGSYMLIALPNPDGTFGCILFLPFEGENSFAKIDTGESVREFFTSHFCDAVPLIPHLTEQFFANPTGSMVTVKCQPWHRNGKVLILGDAAHAIVPFFGQGMNCAFEDCTVFLELLDRHGPDWPLIFQEFEAARKINTDAIADLANDNFVEMRDRVGDPRFLLRKRVELLLEARFPRVFVPKYSMVTFHRIPYSVALSRGEIQDRILGELCDGISSVDELDWPRAESLVRENLTPLELV